MNKDEKNKNFSKFYHRIVDDGILANLSPTAIRAYLVLCRHADYTTRNSRPTRKTIAKEGGLHDRLVSKATEELVKKGLIKKWRQGFRTYYHIFSKDDICPQKMAANPKERDKLPSKMVIYRRDKKTGRFISAKERKERKTIKDGRGMAIKDGRSLSVKGGCKVETSEVESINRNLKERKDRKDVINQELKSKIKKSVPKEENKSLKRRVSQQTINDLKKAMSADELRKYLENHGYILEKGVKL